MDDVPKKRTNGTIGSFGSKPRLLSNPSMATETCLHSTEIQCSQAMQTQHVYNQLLLENLNGSDATTKKRSNQEHKETNIFGYHNGEFRIMLSMKIVSPWKPTKSSDIMKQ